MRLVKGRYNLVGQDYLSALSTKNDATAVFPNYEAPVIRQRGLERVIEPMRWGFPPPSSKARTTITNVRNVDSGFWKPCLVRENRCVVPATAFFEFDQQLRKPRWFKRSDTAMFFFAGIWRPWTGDPGDHGQAQRGRPPLVLVPDDRAEPGRGADSSQGHAGTAARPCSRRAMADGR
ncbi:MAG: hypothetical protein QOJ15_53 [Bradyrhizobium sp.]|jgi:putative SOS response-associated peptidase YedK|nr:hypothetical protein [Bradyrhizobium sp.]